jgi:hypothetical protein
MHPTPSIAETDTPATSQTGCSQVQYTRTPTTKANQNQTVLTTAPPFSRVLAFALYRNGLEPSTRYQISPANARSLTQRHKYRLPAACRVPLQQKHRRVQVQVVCHTSTRSKTQHHGTAFHDTVRVGLFRTAYGGTAHRPNPGVQPPPRPASGVQQQL